MHGHIVRWTAATLATDAHGQLCDAAPTRLLGPIKTDSRQIEPGDVFWAFVGTRVDGHAYIEEARKRGAALVVVQRGHPLEFVGPRLVVDDSLLAIQRVAAAYRRRQAALIIGVTGSVGKTTTRRLIHAALSAQFCGTQSPGNFNNHLGLPMSLLAIEPDHEFAVLELGASQVGEIRDLAEIAQPEVGVITSIGKAHLDGFGSVAGIIQGKGELLEALPPTGFAVLPGDDPTTLGMASRAACRVITVGEGLNNAVRAERVLLSPGRLSFLVEGQEYALHLHGRHQLSNALLAIAIGREIGLSHAVMATELAGYEPEAGRGAWRKLGVWTVIDDTYNASPTSVVAAIEALAMTAPQHAPRYAVLGDMLELGTAAVAEHEAIGRRIAELKLDGLLACGDYASSLARGAQAAGMPAGRIVSATQLDVLEAVLDCWLDPAAVILVKGSRGARMERVINWLEEQALCLETSPRRASA